MQILRISFRPRRAFLTFLLGLCSLVMLALPSSAHNGERTSDPEDGATLTVAPATITFWFKQAVGQDRLTLLLIDPTGSRNPLTILRTEEFRAVAALPPLANGVYSVRWKLLSSDGHPVTNKISFTVAVTSNGIGVNPTSTVATRPSTILLPTAAGTAGSTTSTVAQSATPSRDGTATATSTDATAAKSNETVSTIAGSAGPAIPTGVLDAVRSDSAQAVNAPGPAQSVEDDLSTGAPNWVRWLLRYLSYLAIFVVVGITTTSLGVWAAALAHPRLRRAAVIANLSIAVLALFQVAVLANDIGSNTFIGSLREVPSFDVGIGLIVRTALALAGALLLQARRRQDGELAALSVLSAGLLVTWSFAGHAKSQGMPWVAVPLGALHHGAGAAWLGALVIVGFVARAAVKDSTYGDLQQRMSAFAFGAVGVLSVTGVVQSIRLVGPSWGTIVSTHTILLVAKVLVVGGMLFIGNRNRLLLNRTRAATSPPDLRRPLLTEFGLGLVVLAITSSLVVASPSSTNAAPNARQFTNPQGEPR